MKSDVKISQDASLLPIGDIAERAGLLPEEVECYGSYKGKVRLDAFDRLKGEKAGKLVLVSAITPTPAGEGKTTMTIGLGQALGKLGKNVAVAIREPSLGPLFGVKGGATGGGYSQVVPMEEINLHFTGDLHAVGAAHNLIAAMLDNHIHQWNHLGIDARRVTWRRVIDLNDRSLRKVILGLGGRTEGIPRETGFDITAASEIMAILCLAESIPELKERLARILVGYTFDGTPVTAGDLKASGAAAVMLRDAIRPNLVQTLEGVPAFVHGGPFANIAHGCNSVLATRLATRLADYTVTEAGFGFDLGAEKFFDIKCRYGRLSPSGVVLVATARALKVHGGVSLYKLKVPNVKAVRTGLCNLARHVENVKKFGVPVVVAVNRFTHDTKDEIEAILAGCADIGAEAAVSEAWARGGEGSLDLAEKVVAMADGFDGEYRPLYNLKTTVKHKIKTIAREIYGAAEVEYSKRALRHLAQIDDLGYTHLPICMAKTPKSLSDNPAKTGCPRNFTITVKEIRVAAGAGFLVPITGDILTMPGLPRKPLAEEIDLDSSGNISGLF
jgi:formate--tetrahydrofolate ligase